jgi:hypothetical protein
LDDPCELSDELLDDLDESPDPFDEPEFELDELLDPVCVFP